VQEEIVMHSLAKRKQKAKPKISFLWAGKKRVLKQEFELMAGREI